MARVTAGITIIAKDDASKVFRKVSKGAQDMANRASASFKSLGAATIALNQGAELVSKAYRAIVAPIVQATRAGVEASREFGTALREVSTLVDSAQVSNESLRSTIMELSAEFGRSPVEQTKALYMAISSGAEAGAEATTLLTTANKLAIGGVTQVNTAVDSLTSVMNAYGIAFENSEAVSDKFFATIKMGKTTAGELGASIGQVVSTSSNAGISLDEMFSVIAAGTKVGQSTAMATVGLNAALNAIIKPTKDAEAEAQRLGIAFDSAALRQKGFVGILKEIASNTNKTDKTMSTLFGSVRALRIATGVMTNNFAAFDQVLPELQNSLGATDEAVAKMTGSIDHQIGQVEALADQTKISFGDAAKNSKPFQGAVRETKRILSELIEFLNSNDGKEAANAFFSSMALGAQLFTTTLAIIPQTLEAVIGGPKFRSLNKAFDKVNAALARSQQDLTKSTKAENADLIKEMVHRTKRLQGLMQGLKDIQDDAKQGVTESNLSILMEEKQQTLKLIAEEEKELEHRASLLRARGILREERIKMMQDFAAKERKIREGNKADTTTTTTTTTVTEDAEKKLTEFQKQEIIKRAQNEMAVILKTAKDANAVRLGVVSEQEFIEMNRLDIIDEGIQKEASLRKKGVDAALKGEQKRLKFVQKFEKTGNDAANRKREMDEDNAARRVELEQKSTDLITKIRDQQLNALADMASSAGQAIFNLGRSFVSDLIDSTVTAEEAIANLGQSVLQYLAETLAQWALTEGLKQLILSQTSEKKKQADQQMLAGSLARNAIEVTAEKAASTAKGSSKTKEVVGSLAKDKIKGTGGILGSFASLGPIGIVLAVGAIAALVATIASLISQVKGFNKGGFVTGGTPGTDSVPSLLTPGEFVLPKPTVDAIRRGSPPKTPGRFANGGMVTAGGGMVGTQVVFAPTIQTVALPNSVQNQRYYRDTVSRTVSRLNRNGFK